MSRIHWNWLLLATLLLTTSVFAEGEAKQEATPAGPTPANAPTKITFNGTGTKSVATFEHKVCLTKGESVSIDLLTDNPKDVLRSVKITPSACVNHVIVRLKGEKRNIEQEKLFELIADGDFNVEAFNKRLIGKRLTVVAKRDVLSRRFVASLEGVKTSSPSITATLTGKDKSQVEFKGILLGFGKLPDDTETKFKFFTETKHRPGQGEIVTLDQDAILSLHFGEETTKQIEQITAKLAKSHVSHQLIFSCSEKCPEKEITVSYKIAQPGNAIVELKGTLCDDGKELNIDGFVQLHNHSPYDWTDVKVSIEPKTTAYKIIPINLKRDQTGRFAIDDIKRIKIETAIIYQVTAPQAPDSKTAESLDLEKVVEIIKYPCKSIPGGELEIWEGTKQLSTNAFAELTSKTKLPRRITAGKISGPTITCVRHTEQPLLADKLVDLSLYCSQGRITTYTFKKLRDTVNGAKIILARKKGEKGWSVLERPGHYLLKTTDIVLCNKTPEEVTLLEKPSKNNAVTLNMATGSRNAIESVKKHMSGSISCLDDCRTLKAILLVRQLDAIIKQRKSEKPIREELEKLVQQLEDLESSGRAFAADSPSRIHGVILRRLADKIYQKQMAIADKREQLAKAQYIAQAEL